MAGIYIHIPFCKKKCIYCDFYSIGANGLEGEYVSALIKELGVRKQELHNEPIETIYFGGGTPSLLTAQQIGRIIKAIQKECIANAVKEITVEVNPDDITERYVKALVEVGVNRISMGVQSFDDAELKYINRRHTADEAVKAVEAIKEAGITNISIDLIYGLPGQNMESWQRSINKAVALDVPHISCYCLSYEEGTRLYQLRELGAVKECDEDSCIQMYEVLVEVLKAYGYEHYEVSNFAKEGMYSKHNSSYWNGTSFLGLGASAHSFDGFVRSYNISNVKQYISKIESGNLACEREEETVDEKYDEYIMIRLRTMWGIDSNDLKNKFGEKYYCHFKKESERYLQSGKMSQCGTVFRLTESGIMLSDMIIRDLMA